MRVLERVGRRQVENRLRKQAGQPVDHIAHRHDAHGLAIAMVPESVAAARVRNTRGAPLATATLCEAEEPCWEIAAVYKASSAGEPLIPVARAFLDLLKLPAAAT